MRLGVDSNHKTFVHTIAIDVQHSQGDAGEAFNLSKYVWSPLSKPVLDKGELRDLTLPFRVVAKGGDLAILVEFGVATANKHIGFIGDLEAAVIIEPWVVAFGKLVVVESEIEVSPI